MNEIKLAALLLVLAGGFIAYRHQVSKEVDQAIAAASAEASRDQLRRTEQRITANADIDSKFRQRERELQGAVAAERARSDGLRKQLAEIESAARAAPAASSPANGESTAELARLLGQSIELVGRGQEVAGELANQVEGLQGYIRGVCLDTKASKVQN